VTPRALISLGGFDARPPLFRGDLLAYWQSKARQALRQPA
jgi:hypothetical protein